MGTVARLSEVPEIANGSGRWQPLNKRLGITAFGVNGVVRDPEDAADIEHDEIDGGHQEVYVVVAGRAAFRIGEEEVEAGPGDVVAVPDPSRRATTGRSNPGRASSASAPRRASRTRTASGSLGEGAAR